MKVTRAALSLAPNAPASTARVTPLPCAVVPPVAPTEAPAKILTAPDPNTYRMAQAERDAMVASRRQDQAGEAKPGVPERRRPRPVRAEVRPPPVAVAKPTEDESIVTRATRFIFGRYRVPNTARPELTQVAWLALLECKARYDQSSDATFATYATETIKHTLMTHHNTNFSMLSGMGAKRNYRWWVISQMKQHGAVDIAAMRRRFGGLPKSTDDDLRAMVAWLLSRSDATLDAPTYDTPDSPTLLDMLAAPTDVEPGETDTVDAFLRRTGIGFAPREEFVLRRRLLADDPDTLQVVGDALGITREGARQIEARALGRLRQLLRYRPEMLWQLRPSQRERVKAAFARG